MNRIALVIVFIGAVTVGCAPNTFHRKPWPAYSEVNTPISQTAVFSAVAVGWQAAEVKEIDGKATSCFSAGCPTWVRVLPGRHTFKIRYYKNFEGVVYSGDSTVVVENMVAGHVYHAKYVVGTTPDGKRGYSASVVDLGANSNYTYEIEGVRYPAF